MNNQMKVEFLKQFNGAVERAKKTEPRGFCVGIEFEYFLYRPSDSQNYLATDEEVSEILAVLEKRFPGVFDRELGAGCVEMHPGPVDLFQTSAEEFYNQMMFLEDELCQVASGFGFSVGRSGTVPWMPLKGVPRTGKTKYQVVPDFHDTNRRVKNPRFCGIPVDASSVGVMNAFQFSIQAGSVEKALDMLNRLFLISPLAVGFFGNASIVNGVDTHWNDVRFEVWRRSHDTRPKKKGPERVGLPDQYLWNLEEYASDVCQFPFILDYPEAALGIGIGLFWRTARLKFIGDCSIIEFRPLSMQNTLNEDFGAMFFVLGRLLWSIDNDEPFISMKRLQRRARKAERHGVTDISLINEEFSRAVEGICKHDFFDQEAAMHFLEMAWKRVLKKNGGV